MYQLKKSEASLIFVHSDSLDLVLAAAKTIQFPDDRIITLDAPTPTGFVSLADLTTEGSSGCSMSFVERILSKGEGKSKVAVLCFSSGTTGPPKVNILYDDVELLLEISLGGFYNPLRAYSKRDPNDGA